jgi:GNAT superfamily N-acetyltransferase
MLSIRQATIEDASLLATLIRELGEYERFGHEVAVTEESVARDGFGAHPKFRAIIAESNEQVAGYAIFFEFYSSFQGCAGLVMDDIFVLPQFRKLGIGKALLAHVAAIAIRENYFCVRMEVLNWNELALGFFQRMDTVFLDEWKSICLIGDPLQAAADQAT